MILEFRQGGTAVGCTFDRAIIEGAGRAVFLGAVETAADSPRIDFGGSPTLKTNPRKENAVDLTSDRTITGITVRGRLRKSSTGAGGRDIYFPIYAQRDGTLYAELDGADASTMAVVAELAKFKRKNTETLSQESTQQIMRLLEDGGPDGNKPDPIPVDKTADRDLLTSEKRATVFSGGFFSPLLRGALDAGMIGDQVNAGDPAKMMLANIRWRGNGVRLGENAFNPAYVWLGLSRLPVLRKIDTSLEAGVGKLDVPRQPSAMLNAAWQSDETVILTVEFPNTLRKADGSEDKSYDQISELRTLIAQLRVTPFLPIRWGNHVTASVSDIDALAIEQVIISTVDGFPGMYQVQIAGCVFNWQIYLKDPDKTAFGDYFVWPIFDRYIQRVAARVMDPVSHSGDLKMTVADERRMASLQRYIGQVTSGDPNQPLPNDANVETIKSWVNSFRTDIGNLAKPEFADTNGILFPEYGTGNLAGYNTEALNKLRVPYRIMTVPSENLNLGLGASSPNNYSANLVEKVNFVVTSARILNNLRVKRFLESLEEVEVYGTDGKLTTLGGLTVVDGRPIKLRILTQDWPNLHAILNRIAEQDKETMAIVDSLGESNRVASDPSMREPIMLPTMTATSVQIIMTHRITKLASPGFSQPTMQYWGSPDIQVSLNLGSNLGMDGLKEVYRRCMAQRKRYQPTVTDSLGIEPGFVEITLPLLSELGMQYFVPRSLVPSTVPNVPGREEARLDLDLFTACSDESMQQARKLTQEVRFGQVDIDLNEKRLEQVTSTEKLLDTIPLYPDLFLPTYNVVKDWCDWAETLVAADQSKPFKISFARPDGALGTTYVDPDFYISSKEAADQDFLNAKHLVETGALGVTLTPRQAGDGVGLLEPKGAPVRREEQYRNPDEAKETPKPAKELTPSERIAAAAAVFEDPAAGVESPAEEDPVLPWNNIDATRGMFRDFLWGTPVNRLVGAFPTFLAVFYREGATIGIKRLWDQFYGRAAVFDVSIISSMYKPDSTAVLSIADPGKGSATADLEATIDIMDMKNDTRLREVGAPGSEVVTDEIVQESLGQQVDRTYKREAGLFAGLFTWDPNPEIIQRWRDLANVLMISAGTRVHLRGGYGSQARKLPTLFNGTIADVEISPDMLKVVAASDGIELEHDMLRRATINGNPDKATNSKSFFFEAANPREWILSVLGDYAPPDSLAKELTGKDKGVKIVAENVHGIRHFGAPLVKVKETSATLVEMIRGNSLNRTELGQNIYSSAWAELDEVTRQDPLATPKAPAAPPPPPNVLPTMQDMTSDETILGGILGGVKGSTGGVLTGPLGVLGAIGGILKAKTRRQRKEKLQTTPDIPTTVEHEDETRPGGGGFMAAVNRFSRKFGKTYEEAGTLGKIGMIAAGGWALAPAVIMAYRRGAFDDQIAINTAGKTFWEVCTELAHCTPGYITAVRPFGVFRSTLFFGKPHWPIAYTYTSKSDPWHAKRDRLREITQGENLNRTGTVGTDPKSKLKWNDPTTGDVPKLAGKFSQVTKVFSQVHFANTNWNLVHMGLRTVGDNVYTRCRLFGLANDGSWVESGPGAWYKPGEQVVTVMVDDDILPESQRDMDIATPFRWGFWTPDYGPKKAEHYAQARLAEACRTMYDGHILLLGNGNIHPWDEIYVSDPLTMTKGLCTVREVVHTFGMRSGFITDVKPGAIAWGASAPSNVQVASGSFAISSLINGVMDVLSASQQVKTYLVRYGRGQILRAASILDALELVGSDEELNLAPEVTALRNAALGLSNSIRTEEDVAYRYELARAAIGRGLSKIRLAVQTGTMRITRSQITPVEVVEELAGVSLRLRGVAQSQGISVGDVPTKTGMGSSVTKSVIDAANAGIAQGRRGIDRRGWTSRYDKDPFDSATKAQGVATEGTSAGQATPHSLASLPFVSRGVDWLLGKQVDGVNIALLTRAGRELSAGINGHRGCVIGEPGSATQELKEWIRAKAGGKEWRNG